MRTSKIGNDCLPSDRTKNYIPKRKVHSFVSLYDCIRLSVSTHKEAEQLCMLSHRIIYEMRTDSILSSDSAKKILLAYDKLIKGR